MKVFRPEADTFPAGGVNHRNDALAKNTRPEAGRCLCRPPAFVQRGSAAPVVYTTGIGCGALRAREISGRVEVPVVYTTGIRCAALRAREIVGAS